MPTVLIDGFNLRSGTLSQEKQTYQCPVVSLGIVTVLMSPSIGRESLILNLPTLRSAFRSSAAQYKS